MKEKRASLVRIFVDVRSLALYEYTRAFTTGLSVFSRGGQIGTTRLVGFQKWPCTFPGTRRYAYPIYTLYPCKVRLKLVLDIGIGG